MRKLNFVTGSILVLFSFSGFVSLHSQQSNHPWDYEVATPVQEDVLTDQQKEHSKLYQPYETGNKIRDVLIDRQSEFVISTSACPFLSVEPLPDLINELAQKSDAIVIAEFVSKTSQITTSGTYIFTDYELRVTETFKTPRNQTLPPETTITITRPGGKVLLFGQIAQFRSSAFKPLLPGRRYLLFLTYLPSTGAYRAVSSDSTFDVTETRVESLSEGTVRAFDRDPTALLTKLKLAIH
jgi:hypothetical protein